MPNTIDLDSNEEIHRWKRHCPEQYFIHKIESDRKGLKRKTWLGQWEDYQTDQWYKITCKLSRLKFQKPEL